MHDYFGNAQARQRVALLLAVGVFASLVRDVDLEVVNEANEVRTLKAEGTGCTRAITPVSFECRLKELLFELRDLPVIAAQALLVDGHCCPPWCGGWYGGPARTRWSG